MKKILITFVALIMLAGGGFSALKALKMGPFAEEGEVSEEEAPPPEPPRIIDFDPLYLPIFQGDRVAATIQIQFRLETVGEENEARIIKLLPRLNDAFLRDLYVFIPALLKKTNKIDPEIIRNRLHQVGARITGKGVIKGVIIQSVASSGSR
ncbi:MAG: hypothetical protein IIC04_02020 [Proteobacteria bacterium]|nr:hypothetical protein [Pseudomonadota bacterium]